MKLSFCLLFSVFYINPSASHKIVRKYPGGPLETIICVTAGNECLKKKKHKKELFSYVDITHKEEEDMGIVDRVKLRRAQRIDITDALADYRNEEGSCQKEL